MEFEKSVTFQPAFDKTHSDPAKNYGIQGVYLQFVLKGEKGATQFVLFTGWYLPETKCDLRDPLPADLGYHSPVPQYEGQPHDKECNILGEGGCYYDGSALNARPVFERLLREGSEGVWDALEKEYRLQFECEEPSCTK